MTEKGTIKVHNGATNVPGVYAAGDVADGPSGRVVIAAGSGAGAALSVIQYLSEKR